MPATPLQLPPLVLYSEKIARHYDSDYAAIGRQQDVAFYVEQAKAAAGVVLEVGCGTGRILLPIARAGAQVLGIDPSVPMRARLLAKLKLEPDEVRRRVAVHYGRFERVPACDGAFAAVLAPFRSFQHLLTHEQQVAGLKEMKRVLAPGGRIVFDVFDFNADLLDEGVVKHDCSYEEDGVRVERSSVATWDPKARRLRARFSWSADGKATGDVVEADMRVFDRDELKALLAEADLEAEAIWGDFDRSRWSSKRPRELVVCAKHRDR